MQNSADLKAKDQKKLDKFLAAKPLYDAIFAQLESNTSDEKYRHPRAFMPVLTEIMKPLPEVDKKLLEKIADGLSKMDKEAEIQRDRKGNIIYDTETKDTEIVPYKEDIEIVPYKEDIETYMAREVLPYVPDAKAFWEENLKKAKPVIKTGAEIPFTRYFYKYEEPTPSEELEKQFLDLEEEVSTRVAELFQ